jgi:uncharacterized integral membrane protein (TIGR00698 family)
LSRDVSFPFPTLPLNAEAIQLFAAAFRRFPGLALVVAVSGIAWLAERVLVATTGHAVLEAIVLAILIGAAVRSFWAPPESFAPGIAFAAGTLLEISIVLLGFGADLGQFIRAGLPLVAAIVGVVIAAIFVGVMIGRALGLAPVHALLVACGNAICGNSAIAALAPVVGARKDEVASAIAYTAVLGVAVILGLPFLAPLFGLNDYQYGILAGLTVYAVPQVIAAAYPVSVLAGQTATLVKLVRVLMLGPLVVVLSLRERRRRRREHAKLTESPARALTRTGLGELLPWFVIGFMVTGAMRSAAVVSIPFADGARDAARDLTILAMAALGLNVDIHAIRRVGPKVAATVTGSLAVMVTIALLIVHWLPRAA